MSDKGLPLSEHVDSPADNVYHEKVSNHAFDRNKIHHKSNFHLIIFQIKLLLWKRGVEIRSNKIDLFKYFGMPVLFFLLLILLYETFGFFYPGGLESYLVPIGFWLYVQKNVMVIMFEKSSRLQESMSIMGMKHSAYWLSYFISDGIVIGFIISFSCCMFTLYGLFNQGAFFAILGLLLGFCLSVVPFGFFFCAFFSSPQTAGQATLGMLLGMYVVYIAVDLYQASDETQTIACLFPPLALQLGCASFLTSYEGISLHTICSMMVLDTFLYSVGAWYFMQIWPSEVGVQLPFYFPLQASYWGFESVDVDSPLLDGSALPDHHYPKEDVNEDVFGKPKVSVRGLMKSFSSGPAVSNLSLDMYENQIFALLGHNGAGKTTTINIITGMMPADGSSTGNSTIYGHNLLHAMPAIRQCMGVCPQHDVLFESLSVKEHILFFSQLKGYSYKDAVEESEELAVQFHLEERQDHRGSELSGGQKRKLSVGIAVCGGSSFIILDEPTAGMDPLARRELWDLLSDLKQGRTMLLTTHYMDEADVLGDRVGIMSLGKLQCLGTTQFLKTSYGTGYKLIFDMKSNSQNKSKEITSFIQSYIPGAKQHDDAVEDNVEDSQIVYMLPFNSVSAFGSFFTSLDKKFSELNILSYGVSITSLEDVFLKVGEDHSVKPNADTMSGIGASRTYTPTFNSQVIGLIKRKLHNANNDFVTVPLIMLPVAAIIVAAVLYADEIITKDPFTNALIACCIYLGAFLGAPGLIAEFIVDERMNKLKNVLTVMGCDFKAYWLGTLIADYILAVIPILTIYVSWFAGDMEDFYSVKGGLSFFIILLFVFHLISFSYISSFMFSSSKSCIAFMPLFIILLIILPSIFITSIILIFGVALDLFQLGSDEIGGILFWGLMLLTPHGAMLCALLDTVSDLSKYITGFPPVYATMIFMAAEACLFLYASYYFDSLTMQPLEAKEDDTFDESLLTRLDQDILKERADTFDPSVSSLSPLRIERLRKVFPSKRVGGKPVVACEDLAFHVQAGEIFGLLGANGAGKTTTLSMLTRHLIPTSGNAFVSQHSILSHFQKASVQMGVVTQNNSLWNLQSVQDHLKLFARLRGVPEDKVSTVVNATIDQLELTPHKHKLAGTLSGGMKRKLCVAIALIGDPQVVLLDEPSAGLDPVSRRNLWNVILQTMSHRAVILTTHSMEEAEALCRRIGIMVMGQMRVLGTKQHLKNKYGSGYELVVKLRLVANHAQTNFVNFIQTHFSKSKVISDHGGLMTIQISREEMNMGLLFTEMEANKERLGIEDYSVAQPTLEQVFIRTVEAIAPQKEVPLVGRAASRGSFSGMVRPLDRDLIENITEPGSQREGRQSVVEEVAGEVVVLMNSCGCNPLTVRRVTWALSLLFVIFTVVSIVAQVGALFAVAAVFFLGALVGCCMCCVIPCFQGRPEDDDE